MQRGAAALWEGDVGALLPVWLPSPDNRMMAECGEDTDEDAVGSALIVPSCAIILMSGLGGGREKPRARIRDSCKDER